MQVFQLISLPLFIFSAAVFFYFSFQTFKSWKNVREEVLLHLTTIYMAVGLLIVVSFIGLFFIDSPTSLDDSSIFYFGILYDLFYLEISFFYLTLFSNARNLFEKYIPIIMTIAFLMNLIAGYSQINPYTEIAIVFHAIVILTGLFLFYRTYSHFKVSEKYLKEPEELDLLKYLQNLTIFMIVLLISDGLGFLGLHLMVRDGLVLDEYFILFLEISVVFLAVLVYFISKSIRLKASKIDVIQFMNNLS